jgi:hypothetical protein
MRLPMNRTFHRAGSYPPLFKRLPWASGLQLWTFQRNTAARRFYGRLGFVAVEQTDGSRNEEDEPDVRYRWQPAHETS